MADLTEQLLGEEEGKSRTAYPDSLGFISIGIGCCVDKRVKGTGLCDAAIDAQFQHDRANADAVCARIPHFATLNEVQKCALTSVAFQLGDQILGWKHFMAAMSARDLPAAKAALLDSDWARHETPARAHREVDMLQSGVWIAYEAAHKPLLSSAPIEPHPSPEARPT